MTTTIAILGALIAAVAGVATAWVKFRADHRRAIIEISAKIAEKDFMEKIKESGYDKTRPLSFFVWYHYNFFRLADKGAISIEKLEKHLSEADRILNQYHESRIHTFDRSRENLTEDSVEPKPATN